MIYLHQYPSAWGLSSLSPFCIKVEAFLKMAGLPYEVMVETNPRKGPKGKMPFIRDGEKVVADSSFIIDYLIERYHLTALALPAEKPELHAFKKMIEESLYFAILYNRWIDEQGWKVIYPKFKTMFPPLIGNGVLRLIRKSLLGQAKAQGIGRHSSEEVNSLAVQDLRAIAEYLGNKSFFAGENMGVIDATVYAFLATILKQPIVSPMQKFIQDQPNLLKYIERIESGSF